MNKLNKNLFNRKGMWTQVFLIGFFLLLVVLAIILLTIEKDKGVFDSKREYINQDLRDQHASTMLNDILRREIKVNNRDTLISDAIMLNFDGRYDNEIMKGLRSSLIPTKTSVISIKYSGRERYINLKPASSYKYNDNYGAAKIAGIFKDYEIGKNPLFEANCEKDNGGYASTILPGPGGNINIAFKRCEKPLYMYDTILDESERTWELTAGASETPAEGNNWGDSGSAANWGSKILLVGDSLTVGYSAQFKTCGTKTITTYAQTSRKASEMVSGISNYVSQKPDAVVIWAGTNDIFSGSANVAKTEDLILQLKKAATDQNPNAKIILITLPPIQGYPSTNQNIQASFDAINAWIRQQGDYIDAKALLDTNNDGRTDSDYYGDGLHPNSKGFQLIANQLSQKVGCTI